MNSQSYELVKGRSRVACKKRYWEEGEYNAADLGRRNLANWET
jgi:hypothetical protein